MEILLVILCFLAVYHHVIFPVILKKMRSQEAPLLKECKDWPKISLVIPAFNEEDCIAEKILNTASLDYPADKLEVIIACDGCSDHTYEKAMETLSLPELAHLNANVLQFEDNRGKIIVLNDMIWRTYADVIALSDCSSTLSLDALKRVAYHFNDPEIGVVGGTYRFSQVTSDAEEVYWAYQRAIKKGEASFGAPMGMHGAFYAFKKNLARPLAKNTINDDFILPMKIVAKGYRAIYDEKIHCVESEQTTDQMNWKRRIRIASGNVQQAIKCFDLLSLKKPGIAFCFFSGKFLRAWMPLILASIFILSAWGAFDNTGYLVFFLLQIIGLVVTFLPVSKGTKVSKVIHTLRYIVIGHAAGLLGTLRYLSGLENGAWKRAG